MTCKVRQATRTFCDHAKPARYRLFVKWETVENRTVDFRGSPDFAEWCNLVGYRFAAPPEVEHVHEVGRDFDERRMRRKCIVGTQRHRGSVSIRRCLILWPFLWAGTQR